MLKRTLVIGALFATGIACAGIKLDVKRTGYDNQSQIVENDKAAFVFGEVAANIAVLEVTNTGIRMNVSVVASKHKEEGETKEITTTWNEAVVVGCEGTTEEAITITAVQE